MKQNWKYKYLPCLVVDLGTAGCLLRMAMYRFALDEKGLLTANHPTKWALMLVAAAAAGVILFPPAVSEEERPLTGAAWLPAVGAFALAAGILTAALGLAPTALLENLCRILGLAAAAAQLWAGFCHLRRREPSFACNGVSCLFFVFYIVCNYPFWSGNPQVHHYLFFVAGLILLACTAWCQTAFAAGMGWSKRHCPVALGAAFACLTGIPQSGAALLLLTGAIWAVLSLYRPAGEAAPEAPEV